MKSEKNTNSNETAARIAALADFLKSENENIEPAEIKPDDYTENQFNTPDGDFLVLTDSEADESAAEYIKDSLFAFRAQFILEQTGIFNPAWVSDCQPDVVKSLEEIQGKCCECCNGFFEALIRGTCGLESFINAAIEADGRGHFIGFYDDLENESGNYYIYRVN